MKRYIIGINYTGGPDCERIEETEHPKGKWVKYEDIKLLYSTCNSLIDSNHRLMTELEAKPVPLSVESIKCNCDKASDNPRYRNDLRFDSGATGRGENDAWICPVHGYKKL